MTTISIRHWMRARQPRLGQELPQNPVGARAECRRPTRLLSVVLGSAVIFGSLALTGSWDRASAEEPPCGVEGRAPCPQLSDKEIQRQHDESKAAELRKQATERAATDRIIDDRPRVLHPIRGGSKISTTPPPDGGSRNADGDSAQHRDGAAQHHEAAQHRKQGSQRNDFAQRAGFKPLRKAFGRLTTERRQFDSAAARLAKSPGKGTFRSFRREARQLHTAKGQFHRAAVRFARHK